MLASKKNQVNSKKNGKRFMLPVLFPAGNTQTTFSIVRNDRLENIRRIVLKEYVFTLNLGGGAPIPSIVYITASPSSFLSNINYGDIYTDAIPVTLHNPFQTPSGNYRFSFTHPLRYIISEAEMGQSKQWPQFVTFRLFNAINNSELQVAEDSSLLFEVETWESSLQNVHQEKNSLSRAFYPE